MNYIQEGQGKPVILIHGLADTCHDWDGILPELASAGYSAYAPDLPGHGKSPHAADPSEYTIDKIMSKFEAWIDHLKLAPPLVMIGHSLGGYICLEYVLRHPQACDQLILIAPLFTPRQISPVIYQILKRTIITEKALRLAPVDILTGALRLTPLVQAPIPPYLCRQKAMDFKAADPAVMRLPSSIDDLCPHLSSIQSTTLIIWGMNDLTLNPSQYPGLVSSLPSATARALKNTGHQPHIQRPNIVSKLILEFLQ
jgi:esterase